MSENYAEERWKDLSESLVLMSGGINGTTKFESGKSDAMGIIQVDLF
jgi:hypothetical protein